MRWEICGRVPSEKRCFHGAVMFSSIRIIRPGTGGRACQTPVPQLRCFQKPPVIHPLNSLFPRSPSDVGALMGEMQGRKIRTSSLCLFVCLFVLAEDLANLHPRAL